MATVSIILTEDLLKKIQELINLGVADNKSAVIRKAVDKYVEDQVVESILRAAKEPSLQGDLDELAERF